MKPPNGDDDEAEDGGPAEKNPLVIRIVVAKPAPVPSLAPTHNDLPLLEIEITMALEEELGVVIPDEAVAEMKTAGDLYEHLRKKVDLPPEQLWERIQTVIVSHLGIEPAEVTKLLRIFVIAGATGP